MLWRFQLTAPATFSGIVSATPVVAGARVYVQDLRSNVYALDRSTGRLLWERRFGRVSGGPNGVAVAPSAPACSAASRRRSRSPAAGSSCRS